MPIPTNEAGMIFSKRTELSGIRDLLFTGSRLGALSALIKPPGFQLLLLAYLSELIPIDLPSKR
jgi:hypothetical protein